MKIADGLKTHDALGAYKGVDEPAWGGTPAAGLVRARTKLRTIDADHPVVITQAPLGSVASLVPYRPAFDITGADIYPIAYPPGLHSDLPNKDISVVGDVTRKMVAAAGAKPVWMTLQIAWSGITANQQNPDRVPRFPGLHEERFMAYQVIVDGARGLVFFGGQLTQVMAPLDAPLGWNWRFCPTGSDRTGRSSRRDPERGRRGADRTSKRRSPACHCRQARGEHEPGHDLRTPSEAWRCAAVRRTGDVRVPAGPATAADPAGQAAVQIREGGEP